MPDKKMSALMQGGWRNTPCCAIVFWLWDASRSPLLSQYTDAALIKQKFTNSPIWEESNIGLCWINPSMARFAHHNNNLLMNWSETKGITKS